MRVGWKGITYDKTDPGKMTRNTSPEVVEVCAARGFQVTFDFILFTLLFLLQTKTTEIRRIQEETQAKVIGFDHRRSYHLRTCKRLIMRGYIFAGWFCRGVHTFATGVRTGRATIPTSGRTCSSISADHWRPSSERPSKLSIVLCYHVL
jgi:hypothetical protein